MSRYAFARRSFLYAVGVGGGMAGTAGMAAFPVEVPVGGAGAVTAEDRARVDLLREQAEAQRQANRRRAFDENIPFERPRRDVGGRYPYS